MNERRIIAVDIGGTNMRIAHLGADLRDIKVVPSRGDLAAGPLREHLTRELVAYLNETGLGRQAAAVGVAIAGQIDSAAGIVRASPNLPSLREAPLAKWIAEATGLPAYLDNDVRAAARGELRSPSLQGVKHLVCLYWGTGIGGGVIIAGRPLRGSANAAGEVGHMVYETGGRLCHCQKRGCYEAYAGGWAIAAQARELVAREPDPALGAEPTTADVFTLAASGHGPAVRVRQRAVDALCQLSASLVVAFNPEVLLLGGGLTGHYPQVRDAVAAAVERDTLEVDRQGLRVVVSEMGDEAALWGAVGGVET